MAFGGAFFAFAVRAPLPFQSNPLPFRVKPLAGLFSFEGGLGWKERGEERRPFSGVLLLASSSYIASSLPQGPRVFFFFYPRFIGFFDVRPPSALTPCRAARAARDAPQHPRRRIPFAPSQPLPSVVLALLG